jgi:hypothetical protein
MEARRLEEYARVLAEDLRALARPVRREDVLRSLRDLSLSPSEAVEVVEHGVAVGLLDARGGLLRAR